jgi:hypothetical protein
VTRKKAADSVVLTADAVRALEKARYAIDVALARKPALSCGAYVCNFCGKESREVECLIAGPQVYICSECIEVAVECVAENKQRKLGHGKGAEP